MREKQSCSSCFLIDSFVHLSFHSITQFPHIKRGNTMYFPGLWQGLNEILLIKCETNYLTWSTCSH